MTTQDKIQFLLSVYKTFTRKQFEQADPQFIDTLYNNAMETV